MDARAEGCIAVQRTSELMSEVMVVSGTSKNWIDKLLFYFMGTLAFEGVASKKEC